MASESRGITVVPLNGLNYATWKVQCRMASLKEGLWGIVSCTEQFPGVKDENFPKFLARKDKALATIILTVQPSLLYLKTLVRYGKSYKVSLRKENEPTR